MNIDYNSISIAMSKLGNSEKEIIDSINFLIPGMVNGCKIETYLNGYFRNKNADLCISADGYVYSEQDDSIYCPLSLNQVNAMKILDKDHCPIIVD